MTKKNNFKLKAEEIKPLKPGLGGCLATDSITIDGNPVGFMYRETPDNHIDSGWRFFAGSETEEYIRDPMNTQVFDVNTIANYSPDIIPFLDSPVSTAFERNPETGEWEEIFDFEFE